MTTYLDSAVAALMAEIILQAFGAVYMGFSINHARVNEFYLLGHLKYTPHGSDALIMYAGALLWTVSVDIAFLRAVYTFTLVGGIVEEAIVSIPYYIKMAALYFARGFYWVGARTYSLFDGKYVSSWPESLQKPEDPPDDPPPYVSEKERVAQYIEDMGLKPRLLNELKTLVIALLIPWIAQWVFWIGFVRMAQDLYCPPKIWSLTAVWSFCSVVTVWCGASF
ncbi:hypothetical protein LTR64_000591 [Lithohypha guttulata]|uniref:uncharacterized protein n=1 Tax=Lithohypha guttulata TaxID=1690604 RepID=UPI002DE05A2F|nr:hypothetical protein LTR51_005643 [Lithohypha guttulata]